MNKLRVTLCLLLPLSFSALMACDAEVDDEVGERALSILDYELQSQLEEFTAAELECTDRLEVQNDGADEAAALTCGEWTPVGAPPLPVDEGFRGQCNYWQEIFNSFAECPGGDGNLQTEWRRDCVQCLGQPASCSGWYIYSQDTVCARG